MRFEIDLRGAGGEPVSFERTVHSHGLVRLPPNRLASNGLTLPLRLEDGSLTLATLRQGRAGFADVEVTDRRRSEAFAAAVRGKLRAMLRLDDDLSSFYARAARSADLAWVTAGAGRFLRGGSVFEDLVKTIATTNCTWSATVRMVSALVVELGEPVGALRAFPTPQAMADAPESFYRETMKAGYRGAYLRTIAAEVCSGRLDLDAFPKLADDELEDALLALPGVGPYAAAHMLLLLGHTQHLILDSSTRPKYARLTGGKAATDVAIARRFKPYGRFAGLAFWLFVTRDWIAVKETGEVKPR